MTSRSAPILPPVERPGTFGDATLPLSARASVTHEPPAEQPRTRSERIAAATARGGLDAIPPGFDDADGDWQVISSPSLFERLYLDAAQSGSITAAMVQRNYGVLRAFWDEKIAAMQTGAAKTQLLIKFGGPHRSEEQVRQYPRDLKKALDRLSSEDAIATYWQELETTRRESARQILEPLLDFILINESLEPAETETFFVRATAARLTVDEAAELLHAAISERDFLPVRAPTGDSLPERLRSVEWMSRARLEHTRNGTTAGVRGEDAAPTLESPTPTVQRHAPARLPWAVAALFIVLAGTFVWRNRFDSPPLQSPTAAPAPAQVATATRTTATPTNTPPAPSLPVEHRKPASVAEPAPPPRVDTTAIALEEMRQRQATAERDRAEAARLDQERKDAQAAATHAELQTALQRAEALLASGDFPGAATLLDEARGKAVADPFASERQKIDELRRTAQQRELQASLYKTRLADLEALNQDGRYPEALAMANRMLREADLPADVAARAKSALTFAQDEMSKLMSGSSLKGVRTRRTNKGRNG